MGDLSMRSKVKDGKHNRAHSLSPLNSIVEQIRGSSTRYVNHQRRHIKTLMTVLALALLLVLKPPYQHVSATPTPSTPKQVPAITSKAPEPSKQVEVVAPPPQSEAPKAEPPKVQTPAVVLGTNEAMQFIFAHESSNNPHAINASSGACGLGQALPCSKLLNACGSLDNVQCQIDWFTQYAVARYGSWSNAAAFWQANRWW